MKSTALWLSLLVVLLSGCGTVTKVGTTTVGATVGAVAAGVPGAIAGAAAGDLAGEIIVEPILKLNEKRVVVEQKVDSVWSLLARLGEQAAWLIGAIILLPMLIPLLVGYIIPAPRQKSKR